MYKLPFVITLVTDDLERWCGENLNGVFTNLLRIDNKVFKACFISER